MENTLFLQLRVASTLNFRNSEPAVVYKLARINSMQEASEGNNKLGSDLGNEANQFLQVKYNALSFTLMSPMLQ